MNYIWITILAALPLGAIGADPAADADAAIKQAITARQKAASVDGEWRDVEGLIKQAQAAMQEGNFSTALTLAHQADQQSELGYQQAMTEKNAGFPDYLR